MERKQIQREGETVKQAQQRNKGRFALAEKINWITTADEKPGWECSVKAAKYYWGTRDCRKKATTFGRKDTGAETFES